MQIADGFVVCQDNGSYHSPICAHPTLQEAGAWLIGFWTHEDGLVSSKYNPDSYVIGEWKGGEDVGWSYWRVTPDGDVVEDD